MSAVRDPALAAALRQPFAEQVAFFRHKLGTRMPTQRWDELWQTQHDNAFMVAGAARADLLADLAAAVEKAIVEGETLEGFRTRFADIIERHGWAGFTGDDRGAAQPAGGKGLAWRTRVIYETNLITSYSAARLAQLREGGYAWWVYRHSDFVRHPRPHHLALNGITRRADDPFWKTYAPPNGWGCRCRIVGARGPAGIARAGGDAGKQLPDWVGRPDPKTGAPVGVDKGFAYQPGATVADAVREAVAKKTIYWPHEIAKAYMQDVPANARDPLAVAIRSQPETSVAARRYAERAMGVRGGQEIDLRVEPYQTLGLLTQDELARLGKADLWEWVLSPDEIGHAIGRHADPAREALQGQLAVTADDYAVVARALLDGSWKIDGVTDTGAPAIAHEWTDPRTGVRYTFVWEVRSGLRMVALKSLRKRPAPVAERSQRLCGYEPDATMLSTWASKL